jgi:nucleoside-diphosphate-sugar epimerase
MTDKGNKKALVQNANIRYHTKLAETYDQTQPYFRAENVIQVRTRLEKFAKATGGKRLLDIGCGTGFIPLTIKRIFNGKAPVIYGDGKQTRDYLYVTDTANAAIEVYDSKSTRNKVLNIASGKEMSIETLIKLIAKYLNCDKPIVYEQERPGDVRRHIANIYLAEDLIGFKSTINLEEGLKLTIEWYKKKIK